MSFDRDRAFNDLVTRWPSTAPVSKASKARSAFDSIVKDKKWWVDLDAAADAELSKRKPSSLAGFLRSYAIANGIQLVAAVATGPESPDVTVPLPAVVGLPPVAPLMPVEDPAVMAAFHEVWPTWPANEDFHEKETEAEKAWRRTAKVRDVGAMVRACKFYTDNFNDPVYGMVYPMHLRNFLTRDDHAVLDEWVAKADDGPSPEDRAEFWGMYSCYPDHKTKEHDAREAMVFWRRHIKADERLDFLCAIRAYKKNRRDSSDDPAERAMYTMGFNRFIGEWRSHITYQSVGLILWKAVLVLLNEHGIKGNWGQDLGHKLGTLCLFGPDGKKRTALDTARECFKRGAEETHQAGKVDPDALAAEAVRLSYIEACKPPAPTVRLDSNVAREGDPNPAPPTGGIAG